MRTVKSSLKKTLHNSQVEKVELITIITEIEGIINSRPLTFVSDVPSDQGPLTPAHFLLGKPVSIGEVGDDTFIVFLLGNFCFAILSNRILLISFGTYGIQIIFVICLLQFLNLVMLKTSRWVT